MIVVMLRPSFFCTYDFLRMHNTCVLGFSQDPVAVQDEFLVQVEEEAAQTATRAFGGESFIVGRQLHVKWLNAVAGGGKLQGDLVCPLLFAKDNVP